MQTGTQNAAQQASAVAKSLSFLSYPLLAFGFELGVLRTLGATGRQTLVAVLGEALIVGAIATEGDFRDWPTIRDSADSIADALEAEDARQIAMKTR